MLGKATITDPECTDAMKWFLCETANEIVMKRCLLVRNRAWHSTNGLNGSKYKKNVTRSK